jgi:C4-dicarboxylate-specific signal transduction histidine kinase
LDDVRRARPGRRHHREYAIDITDRKRAEAALVRNEKLASLRRLVASISHEINNPLEATTNLLYLAKDVDGLPVAAREYLLLADAELKRIAHITRQSLGFYRESSSVTEVSVPEILDATIDLLRSKIANKNAHIERRWSTDLMMQGIAGELRQIFSNLLTNSLDDIDSGGRISSCLDMPLRSPGPNILASEMRPANFSWR